MGHYNPKYPTLEALERHVFQILQKMFGKVLTMVLEQMDAEIAEARDKRRFRLKDRRNVCQEDFKGRAFYHLDRFHVACDLYRVMKDHPRYSAMKRALNENDPERLIVELNSAVGTMATPEGEAKLEAFIAYVTKHKEALCDDKAWLEEQGMDTRGMCTMGAPEGLMSQFAARLKQGRSWSAAGVQAMTQWMIASKDRLKVKTSFGQWVPNREENGSSCEAPKTVARKRLIKKIVNEVRDSIPYMKQSSGTMIHRALKGLIGF